MRKPNAFLLIEVFLALSVFTVCALGIALSSAQLHTYYLKAQQRRRALIIARNSLEQSSNHGVISITSSAFRKFLHARGIKTLEPFLCKKIQMQENYVQTLVGIV